jgi:hypothetical protein
MPYPPFSGGMEERLKKENQRLQYIWNGIQQKKNTPITVAGN